MEEGNLNVLCYILLLSLVICLAVFYYGKLILNKFERFGKLRFRGYIQLGGV